MNTMNYNQIPLYQNPYQMPQSNMYMPKQLSPQNNGIIWVQGIEGAKAYQIPQNSNIILMDSEKNRMYIKTSDNIGMCNLRIFDFTEVTETSQGHNSVATQPDLSQYVTRDELNNILEQLNGGKDNEQSVQPTKSNKSNSTK